MASVVERRLRSCSICHRRFVYSSMGLETCPRCRAVGDHTFRETKMTNVVLKPAAVRVVPTTGSVEKEKSTFVHFSLNTIDTVHKDLPSLESVTRKRIASDADSVLNCRSQQPVDDLLTSFVTTDAENKAAIPNKDETQAEIFELNNSKAPVVHSPSLEGTNCDTTDLSSSALHHSSCPALNTISTVCSPFVDLQSSSSSLGCGSKFHHLPPPSESYLNCLKESAEETSSGKEKEQLEIKLSSCSSIIDGLSERKVNSNMVSVLSKESVDDSSLGAKKQRLDLDCVTVRDNICIEIASDDDDDDEETDGQLLSENVTNENNIIETKISGDICLICGSTLTKIVKNRVNHLKRCAKKYGVTFRDVKGSNDEEDFADTSLAGLTEHTDQNTEFVGDNATSEGSKMWHGNADLELVHGPFNEPNNLSANTNGPLTLKRNEVTPTKQTSLTNFFSMPVKSLNYVLLAGARRMAQRAAIVSANNTSDKKKPPFKQGFQKRTRSEYSSSSCPTHKRITGTDFICDGFHYAKSTLSANYFLTHFHSDHYGGISKTFNAGTIYCSLPTANLVHQQLGVDRKYLHPLPMMSPTVLPSLGKPVTVTLLDANHCPGAVMFLFELGSKKILHVGDFRWNRNVMLKQPLLQGFESLRYNLDELFLDTTYCNEKYSGIPTQEAAIQATIQVVENHLFKSLAPGTTGQSLLSSHKILFLFGSYTIGKERIYLGVAQHFGMKVYVDSRRYRILSALNWPVDRMKMLTTNKEETSIWVVPLGHINFKSMGTYLEQANKQKVFATRYTHMVGFRPTGWTFNAAKGSNVSRSVTATGSSNSGGNNNMISTRSNGNCTVHGVPYSEHSSFAELVDCLICLKPKKIIPTVAVSKSKEQIDLLLDAMRSKLMANET